MNRLTIQIWVPEQEICQPVKKLKNKKLPFVDEIRNDMTKASLD